MNRTDYPDSAFATIDNISGKKFRLFLHHDQEGSVDIDKVESCLDLMVKFLKDEKLEALAHLTQHKLEEMFRTDAGFDRYEEKTTYHTFRASLDGLQQPESVDTEGSGGARFVYHNPTRTLFYDVRFKNLSSKENAAHIHVGKMGEDIEIIIPLELGNRKLGIVELTVEQETLLFSGGLFINIHSVNHPAGEIRGQILPYRDVEERLISSEVVEQKVDTKEEEKEDKEKEGQEDKEDPSEAAKHLGKEGDKKKKKKKKVNSGPSYSSESFIDLIKTRNSIEEVADEVEDKVKNEHEAIYKAIDEKIANYVIAGVSENPKKVLQEGKIFNIEAKLVSVEQDGSIKFFRVSVGDPEFPFIMFFEVVFNADNEAIRVTFFDHSFPVDLIPDVIKFLNTLKSMK